MWSGTCVYVHASDATRSGPSQRLTRANLVKVKVVRANLTLEFRRR